MRTSVGRSTCSDRCNEQDLKCVSYSAGIPSRTTFDNKKWCIILFYPFLFCLGSIITPCILRMKLKFNKLGIQRYTVRHDVSKCGEVAKQCAKLVNAVPAPPCRQLSVMCAGMISYNLNIGRGGNEGIVLLSY